MRKQGRQSKAEPVLSQVQKFSQGPCGPSFATAWLELQQITNILTHKGVISHRDICIWDPRNTILAQRSYLLMVTFEASV